MDDRYIKTEHDGYVYDTHTRAIINRNINEYTTYKKEVQDFKKMKTLEQEVSSLKSDITDIKTMLSQILGRING